jgi:2-polyprenyl-6-methoxyphenol hydroxylase-like FAD-dependent oxidoreductase
MPGARIPTSTLATTSGHDFRVLIVGGGIGGVAAALALSQAGFTNILVLERNSTAQTVGGAGISVKANLCRHLSILGVWEDVCKGLVVPQGWLAIGEQRSRRTCLISLKFDCLIC